jgi:uncharacterized protein (DUF2062 family)
MFQRREPRTVLQKLRELLWPSMGWGRMFTYVKHRLVRMSDTTHKIALGLGLGAAISFSPLLGTHFLQAAFIAYIFRANLMAAIIGTFIGNPWTFPLMWWISLKIGSDLFNFIGLSAARNLPDELSPSILWHLLWEEPMRIFWPWMLGAYICVIITAPIYYFICYRFIAAAKLARTKARLRKVHLAAREVTGQKK